MKNTESKTVYAIVRAFEHENEAQSHVLQVHASGKVEVFTAESGYTTKHRIPAAIIQKARDAEPHSYIY